MPYRMGRAGRFFWPYGFHWMGFWPHAFHSPYWSPFYPPSREEERAMLEDQARTLEEELERIRARLKDLKKAGKEKSDEK